MKKGVELMRSTVMNVGLVIWGVLVGVGVSSLASLLLSNYANQNSPDGFLIYTDVIFGVPITIMIWSTVMTVKRSTLRPALLGASVLIGTLVYFIAIYG